MTFIGITDSLNRINRWGTQRVGVICRLLNKHAPFLRQVCELLNENLYQRIIAGEALTIRELPAPGGSSWMDRISAAIEDGDEGEDEDDEDEDEMDTEE